ncbi:MAG: hypothetical protein ACT4NV_05870 [Rhodoferax sp.]
MPRAPLAPAGVPVPVPVLGRAPALQLAPAQRQPVVVRLQEQAPLPVLRPGGLALLRPLRPWWAQRW